MTEKIMTKTMKPHDKGIAVKPAAQKKSEAELDDKTLENVSGGKPCASGQHIKEGVITT